jgi:hypothetical protein
MISVAPSAVPAHLGRGDTLVEPEQCGDGIDNNCDGEVDDLDPCSGPAVVVCRCLFPAESLTLNNRCLPSGALCGLARVCEPFCIEDFGKLGLELLGTEVHNCVSGMCNPQ